MRGVPAGVSSSIYMVPLLETIVDALRERLAIQFNATSYRLVGYEVLNAKTTMPWTKTTDIYAYWIRTTRASARILMHGKCSVISW